MRPDPAGSVRPRRPTERRRPPDRDHRPGIGQTLVLRADAPVGSTAVSFVIGMRAGVLAPPVSLAPLALPTCTFWTDLLLAPVSVPGLPNQQVPVLTIPDVPELIPFFGFTGLSVTALVLAPPPIVGPPLLPTDELVLVIGT
jgi:hypothetical protein